MRIWHEMDMIDDTNIPEGALETVLKLQQKYHCRMFLIKLRPEFKNIRASILNHNSISFLDSILANLLAEETRLASLSSLSSPPNFFASYKGKYCDYILLSVSTVMRRVIMLFYFRNQRDFGKPKSTTSWIIDLGTTHLMTGYLTTFASSKHSSIPSTITVANGINLDILRSGTLKFTFPNFLSLDMRIGKVIGRGRRQRELFILDLGSSSNSYKCFLALSSQEVNSVNAL
ncbi:hypothetical protein FXO37_35429 [Capsicum annuum]|nr:hypothetical protein FXO37_35429 [Capsicum annuum]